jgi:peptide/nickel transport system permease protein
VTGVQTCALPISYTWRTFFLIYSSEDYVEMAKAKGLDSSTIERRYILRPTLPTIITNLALIMIGRWQGAPIFETVFNWPGLGQALFRAIGLFDTPVIVGSTVIFAYLLAITVFLLDFIYALVDPRVKVGGSEGRAG